MFSGLRAPTLFSRFGGSNSALPQGAEVPPPVPDGKPLPAAPPPPRTGIPTPSPSPTSPMGAPPTSSIPAPSGYSQSPARSLRPPLTSVGSATTPSRSVSQRNIAAITSPQQTTATPTRTNSSATINGTSSSAGGDACHVTVRMRPLTDTEESSNLPTVWDISDEYNRVGLSVDFAERNRKQAAEYFFDAVQVGSDNRDLYEQSAKDVVRAAMEGINGTVFAYGQTASGKTYSMMGIDEQPGVIPQAVDDIFGYIREQSGDREYLLRVSYMEIYNETIRDLLSPEQVDLRIHEDRKRGVFVAPLKEEIVTSPKQVMRIIRKGEENRHFGATDYNEHSSRSHTIFQLVVESRERGQSGTASPRVGGSGSVRGRGMVMISQLNLIDLAGSEKATTDQDRRKEGAFINKSLLTLGTVISKLTDGKSSTSSHIPYRDSKLTRILQASLSGNAKISVICTISPAGPNAEETQNTLKFASRVKKVTVNAQANRIVDEKALLQKYKQEIDELRQQLSTTNELLERERRQQQIAGMEGERKKYEEQLVEGQIARTALKERIDHLTNLILTSKTITSKHLLDWSAPPDPLTSRASVMLEDGLLPASPNLNGKRTPNSGLSKQFSDKGFLDRHIREIDARDEKIRNSNQEIQNLKALLMQLKSSRDGEVLSAIEQYEKTNGQSVKSMRTVVSELDNARRQNDELEVVCGEMEDRIREFEARVRELEAGGKKNSMVHREDVDDLIDENRALKSTVKGLRIELDQRRSQVSCAGGGEDAQQQQQQKQLSQTISSQRIQIESLTNEIRQSQKTITTLRDSIRMLELSNDMFVQSASRAHSPTNTNTSGGSGYNGSAANHAADTELALDRERKLRSEEGRASVERIAALEAELACVRAELGVFGLVGAFGAMGNGTSS
ncbi:P-loop containing nucleoside triphosphate hydrolase protein [Powellomyces hirtus]|nr:P-loop containing nucleoside triphosphate hydrolase protein [Powellomyces hirtus]